MRSRAIPLLSVVIPTAGRPEYLARAVESALLAAPDGDVEVIVVPNGSDETWRRSLASFTQDPRLRIEPIPVAHGNAARNHGLALARGKFVRFLDDDDYLMRSACGQLEMLVKTGAEICSGNVDNVDEDGASLGSLKPPNGDDFVCAAVSVGGFTLPVGNVFLRSALSGYRWNEAVDRLQDNVWMIGLAEGREWKWVHLSENVGVWFQHPSSRVSSVRTSAICPTQVIEALFGLHKRLQNEHRITARRARSIASALLGFVHRHFPSNPLYWHRVAVAAREIAPSAIPDHAIFSHRVVQRMDPLWLEWSSLPLRLVTRTIRDARGKLFGWDYRRRL